jgi:hypothetical protein
MTDQPSVKPQAKSLNPDFVMVASFSAIGLLAMLNPMLHFPKLGAVIAQYNQF